jgi:hypothetical protein
MNLPASRRGAVAGISAATCAAELDPAGEPSGLPFAGRRDGQSPRTGHGAYGARGKLMALITEHDGAINGYEAIDLPSDSADSEDLGATILRRRSALPSRRAVLYLRCPGDSFVPEDLVTWYTARGFHFYVADLRPPGHQDERAGSRRRSQSGKALRASFARLDASSAYLREVDGVDSLIISGHAAGAVTAALWCDARRDDKLADVLILIKPAFGRRQRKPLGIPCPVLIISGAGASAGDPGEDAPPPAVPGGGRGKTPGLGAHVTLLHLVASAPDGADGAGPGQAGRTGKDGIAGRADQGAADRRRFFDEMGRWMGAYMYGQVRDQLL